MTQAAQKPSRPLPRPLPRPDVYVETTPFWEAAKQHKLLLQCGRPARDMLKDLHRQADLGMA